MATAKRPSPSSLIEELFESPYAFEFPQAVRLLQGLQREKTLGATDNPRLDPVHLQAHVDFAVSSSDIKSLTPGEPPLLTVTFLGIGGIQGPLPEVFTEILLDRIKVRDHGFRDFLDIFNHRLIIFWYGFYGKLYPGLHDAPLDDTDIGQSLMDLGGMRHRENEQGLLPLGPLFWQRSGSSEGLEQSITSYFRVPCRLERFIGGWNRIHTDQQTRLGRVYHELGNTAILGHRSFDQGKSFKVVLGPLSYELFQNFLPSQDKASGYSHLKTLIAAYFDTVPDVVLDLILEKEEIPKLDMSGQYRLGYDTWLNSRGPFPTHANVLLYERDHV